MDKRILRNTLWLLPIWVFLLGQLAYASLYEDIFNIPSSQDMPSWESSSDWKNSKVEPLYNPEYPQIEPTLPPPDGEGGDSTGIWGWFKKHLIEPVASFFNFLIDNSSGLNDSQAQRSWEVSITYYTKPHTPEPMPLLSYTEGNLFWIPNQHNTYKDGTWHITAYTYSWVGLKNGLVVEHTWEADVVQDKIQDEVKGPASLQRRGELGKIQGEVKYVGVTNTGLKAIGNWFKYNPQFPFREPFTE